MKNFCALLIVVLLSANCHWAVAQETLSPERSGLGDLPPAAALEDDSPSALADDADWDAGGGAEIMPEPLIEGEDGELFEGSILGEPMQMLCPAYFESSGTWLQRGYWYTEVDYAFLNRGWDRKGLLLAFETTTGSVPSDLFAGGRGPVVGTNELRIRGERPGAEGLGRVKLGRFLFRDTANRDHMTEVSYFGGGNWAQSASLQAATPGGLEFTDYIDRVNPSFDGARGLSFDYQSEMNTAEWNYVVKQRMQRDQLVMQPTGQWVRKATPTKTWSYLAGLRYLNHRETLGLDATEVPVSASLDENGFYRIATENNMLGTQAGVSWAHETARWSIGATGKAGAYWNRIDLNSQFQVGETTVLNSGVTNSEEDDLSFIGEFQLQGKWHLRPNLSLRAGMEIMFVDSIALAPFQLNFIPGGFTPIAASGDSVYIGTSLGVESYW